MFKEVWGPELVIQEEEQSGNGMGTWTQLGSAPVLPVA